MSSEHREYEVRPVGTGRTAVRSVKLPGEQRHTDRAESAKNIAKRLSISKREQQLKDRTGG